MSRNRASEGENDRNSSQNNDDCSNESSFDDNVGVQSKSKDEPVPKRRRLSAEVVADPVIVRTACSNQNQQHGKFGRKTGVKAGTFMVFNTVNIISVLTSEFSLSSPTCHSDGLSVEAQQTILRHLLGNGNQVQVPFAQAVANAEISAQLRTILIQQRLLLNGGYYPPQYGSAAHFSQSGTLDALASLASLSGTGYGYPSTNPVASLFPMQMLQQQVHSRMPDSIGSTISAGGIPNNFTPSSLPAFTPQLTGRPAVPLSIEADQRTLSEFQRLVRKHIELFEAKQEDVESNAQGRNRPIVLGQVGIRCCHCSHLPPKLRCRGSTYYPTTLQGLYQAAQNMATGHLCKRCSHVPSELRIELVRLKECKSSAGGGKSYWGDGVRSLGVFEAPTGLRFLPLS